MPKLTPEQQLVEGYRRASKYERLLVQLCALKYGGISVTALAKLVQQVKWKPAKKPRLQQRDVKASIAVLHSKRIVVFARDQSHVAAPELLDLCVQDTVREGTFTRYARVVQAAYPLDEEDYFGRSSAGPSSILRNLRIAFYRGDAEGLNQQIVQWSGQYGGLEPGLLKPFDATVFGGLPNSLKSWHLLHTVYDAIHLGTGTAEPLGLIEPLAKLDPSDQSGILTAWIDVSVARGDLDALRRIDKITAADHTEAAACVAFLEGDVAAAERGFDVAAKRLRGRGRKPVAIRHFAGLFQLMILLRRDSAAARAQALKIAKFADKEWPLGWARVVGALQRAVRLQESTGPPDLASVAHEAELTQLVTGYVWCWLAPDSDAPLDAQHLEQMVTRYRSLGLGFLASEAALLLQHLDGGEPSSNSSTSSSGNVPISLVSWITPVHAWERGLAALTQLAASELSTSVVEARPERLIWQLEYRVKPAWLFVEPHVQKRTKTGWTKGRAVSLKRLRTDFNTESFSYLDDRDREICRCIEEQTYSRYGRYLDVSYDYNDERLARALVGHPRVYAEGDRQNPIEITSREPQLVITKSDDGSVRIAIDPRPGDAPVVVLEDGPHRLVLVVFSSKHRKLDEIVGKSLKVPEAAKEQVLATAQQISSLVGIQSEIGGAVGTAEVVELEPRPHPHLVPYHDGLRLEMFVRPFGDSGPFFRPGHGGENVFADIDGAARTGRRDLVRERGSSSAVVAACPSLAKQADSDELDFYFTTPVEALELLLELEPLAADGTLVMHWPRGQKFKLAGRAGASQFRLRIRKDRDWFAASGELEVDPELSLEMMKLMELVDASSSRFVQLDDGRFLALTAELRRLVSDLGAGGQRLKKKVRFPAIHAAALDDLDDSLALDGDDHWQQCVARMRAARDLKPKLPSTLQAELRDYQCEGFAWLARLAHWGVGGCLADDMGLGKTIQALAILLERGAGGPALVVCPTSVGFNWESECRRFAPTLTPRVFGAGDRKALLESLGPRDVVICSYGLLHYESELLQTVAWHTVVLDEAQAIKNMATKRSRAVMSLDAGFRLILTGTPLENHLGELWNLFNFINPFLLGSHESFRREFAVPIERDDSQDAKRRLKRLIQPFILRRTKTQVLDELPSRTEITLQVELSKEEMALYEALRQRAVDKLAEAVEDEKPAHLKILAEIMRLRRVCCHPRLVLADSKVASSKLAVFSKTIDELLENRHKALVFSQFVGHLKVLREELDKKGVSYQYLDGSTPTAQRRKRVEAFQAGSGDVFLISLKAGGQGLNLTAADYVIHMDPWWNPAVEDQASDRAHRIGQQRPVTIYRLVAKGTIEEKIVELHRTKRDLADTLLEGADMSGKLSGDELLRLLRE